MYKYICKIWHILGNALNQRYHINQLCLPGVLMQRPPRQRNGSTEHSSTSMQTYGSKYIKIILDKVYRNYTKTLCLSQSCELKIRFYLSHQRAGFESRMAVTSKWSLRINTSAITTNTSDLHYSTLVNVNAFNAILI